MEYFQEHFPHPFFGFPWELLGYTQWKYLSVIQLASWTGVRGISFLLVAANAALTKLNKSSAAVAAGLLLIFVAGKSALRTPKAEDTSLPMRIVILQPNVDQYKKWTRQYEQEIRKTFEELILEAGRFKPDLIVWPEASVPSWFNDPRYQIWVQSLVRKTNTHHLIGALWQTQGDRYYNSAFTLEPSGKITGSYQKTHLIPFGEYVPFREIFGKWIGVLDELGDTTPGDSFQPLPTPLGNAVTPICYEMIFPDLVRRIFRNRGDLIINLTNDGWYLGTSEPMQHFSMAVLRAVEHRSYVLRAANSGISAVIDPWGRVLQKTRLAEKAVLVCEIPKPTRLRTTPYDRYGNWLEILSAAYLFVMGLWVLKTSRIPVRLLM